MIMMSKKGSQTLVTWVLLILLLPTAKNVFYFIVKILARVKHFPTPRAGLRL